MPSTATNELTTEIIDSSKDNYNLLRSYLWSNKAERLGFDEVSQRECVVICR